MYKNFKSNIGGIDINFSDLSHLDKYKGLEGSDGSVFKGYDIIDSALVTWNLDFDISEYGVKSFLITITNVRVSIKDEDENILDINFNCDEYDIHYWTENRIDWIYPTSIYINLKDKRVEVTY